MQTYLFQLVSELKARLRVIEYSESVLPSCDSVTDIFRLSACVAVLSKIYSQLCVTGLFYIDLYILQG